MNKSDKEYKSISLDFINPGMSLSFPVYTKDEKMLLRSNTPFTKELLSDLKAKGIDKLYYFNKLSSEVQHFLDNYQYTGPRTIQKSTQKKAVKLMDTLVHSFKNLILDINPESVNALVDAINHDLDTSNEELVNLLEVMEFSDYLYTHSLNVGIISMLFAKKLRLSYDSIMSIGVAAFLHDIGMIHLPSNLIYKEDTLTNNERTLLEEHPELAYKMVEKNKNITSLSKEIIYSHHERYDGSGYPRGIQGGEVKVEYEVVALADIFDALTSLRPFREKAYKTEEALKIILDHSNSFRKEIVTKFVKEMVILFKESNFYPEGSIVQLNTKELARVEKVNKNHLLTPVISIIANDKGESPKRSILIDLKSDFTRYIVRKVDIDN